MIVQELYSLLGLKIDKDSWTKGDKFLGAVKTGFTALVAGFGLNAIENMISSVADMADHAGKAAQKLGITTEAVQELGYAAKLSDIEASELEGALFKLSRGLKGVAEEGSGPAADALQKLGISYKDLKGESLDQNLEVIADAFAKMPDGPKKAAVAMDLFGRTGTKLIPLLNEGKEGIVELRNEAHELGIVVDTETAKSFEEFNDAQTKLSETWRGIKTQVVSALLPTLMQIVESLQEWINENRELIQQGLEKVITAAAYAVKGLAAAIEFALKFIQAISSDSDVLYGIVIALGLAFGVMAIQAIAAWVAAAAPVIAFVALVAAVYIGVQKLIKHWDKVKDAVARAIGAVHDKLGELGRYIAIEIPAKIHDAFVSLGEGIKEALANAFDWVVDKAKEAAAAIWSEIKDIPVIGRIAQGAEMALGGPSVNDLVSNAQAAVARNQEVLSDAGGGGATSVDLGDINMTVQAAPGMDTEQLAELAAQKADEKRKQQYADAYDSLRGGRR